MVKLTSGNEKVTPRNHVDMRSRKSRDESKKIFILLRRKQVKVGKSQRELALEPK